MINGFSPANVAIGDFNGDGAPDLAVGGISLLFNTTFAESTSMGLGVPSGGSETANVSAGQTASYTLSIGGGGMNGMAALTCTGAPKGANCSVPANVPFNANTPSNFSVTVATTSRMIGSLSMPHFAPLWAWAIGLVGLVAMPGRNRKKRARKWPLQFLPLLLLLVISSCGGGNSNAGGSPGPQPNPNGTPAGTYILTVTATSGAAKQSVSLTLNVQ